LQKQIQKDAYEICVNPGFAFGKKSSFEPARACTSTTHFICVILFAPTGYLGPPELFISAVIRVKPCNHRMPKAYSSHPALKSGPLTRLWYLGLFTYIVMINF